MQNQFILFFVLLCCYTASAQEGLKIAAQFTPGISITINQEDRNQAKILDEQAAFAYNSGFLIGYGITEIFSISTGVAYSSHTAAFIHHRAQLPSGAKDINFGKKISRQSHYVRVPLLLELSTDPNLRIGFFARLGPHFDFLSQASYKDSRLDGFSRYDADKGIDLRQEISLYQKNTSSTGILSLGRKNKIYADFVAGITVELGTQIRINDHLKLTILAHAEGSSNPEGEGAASLAHNLTRGDYLVTSNSISDPIAASNDKTKAQEESTPFHTVFPNYRQDDAPYETFRSPTWNMMLGLQIGLIYTYQPQ